MAQEREKRTGDGGALGLIPPGAYGDIFMLLGDRWGDSTIRKNCNAHVIWEGNGIWRQKVQEKGECL